MLRIRRAFAIEDLGFRLDSHLGLAEDHRVVAVGLSAAVVTDGRLLPREPSPERSYLYVVVEGSLELHRSSRRVDAPACVVAESRGALYLEELLRARGPHRALAFQLDRSLLDMRGEAHVAPLDAGGEAAATGLFEALAHPSSFDDVAAAERALFEALRREATPALRLPELSRPLERHERFAGALGVALGKVGERPGQIDLEEEGERSERTARRLFAEIAHRYGWAYERWQTLRRQWSTTLACFLLAVPGARPADVARKVGFASVTSLHHALERAGLPPPGEIALRAARFETEAARATLAPATVAPAIAKIGRAGMGC